MDYLTNDTMHRPVFYKDNLSWHPVNLPPINQLEDKLSPAIYEAVAIETPEGVKYSFEIRPLFALPQVIYGTAIVDKDCILKSYSLNENNLGVLLSGVSGAGKSLLAKLVCNDAVTRLGIPVLIITKRSVVYIKQFTDIFIKRNQSVVFFIDEFDKITQNIGGRSNIEEAKQNQNDLLSILDGYMDTHNLYLFTVNETKYVNQYFFNRPSRIRYHYKFDSLPREICDQLIDSTLLDKSNANIVRRVLFQVENPSFDLINEFITECNRFHEINPEILIKHFNVSYSNKCLKESYRIILTAGGKSLPEIIETHFPNKELFLSDPEFDSNIKLNEITDDMNYIRVNYNQFIHVPVKRMDSGRYTGPIRFMPTRVFDFKFLDDGGISFKFKMNREAVNTGISNLVSDVLYQHGQNTDYAEIKKKTEEIITHLEGLEYSVKCVPIAVNKNPIIASDTQPNSRYRDTPF